MRANFLDHGPSCRCTECQVLSIFEDDGIDPAGALMTLIPLVCALLAGMSQEDIGECLAIMQSTTETMRRASAESLHGQAAGHA